MITFFLQHLSGRFCPFHRLRSYGYAPSSNAKTDSKICNNKKLFEFMITFFLQHLFGRFCPFHRLRSYGYAPSSNAKTDSKICNNKKSLINLNSF